MIAYLDGSVVLRLVLGEPSPLANRQRFTGAVASALTEVECLRTLDRLARMGGLSVDEVADRRMELYRLLEQVELTDVTRPVLRRASEPFPTPLGTLDAIHLATALSLGPELGGMVVYDRRLADAARRAGVTVWAPG